MSGWQPIETAPEYAPHLKVLIVGGAWLEPTIVGADGAWWRYSKDRGSMGIPTHWMEIPSPPSPEKHDE